MPKREKTAKLNRAFGAAYRTVKANAKQLNVLDGGQTALQQPSGPGDLISSLVPDKPGFDLADLLQAGAAFMAARAQGADIGGAVSVHGQVVSQPGPRPARFEDPGRSRPGG